MEVVRRCLPEVIQLLSGRANFLILAGWLLSLYKYHAHQSSTKRGIIKNNPQPPLIAHPQLVGVPPAVGMGVVIHTLTHFPGLLRGCCLARPRGLAYG